jgi:hypothetical protein
MKKRLATLVAAALVAMPLTVVTAAPASACDRHPCHAVCKVNPAYVEVGEDGTVTVGNGSIMECYY